MNHYITLAKRAMESYIKEKRIIEPPRDLPSEFFNKKSGTFVTIKKEGKLRGCIGTCLPTKENIADEIIHNAIAAATEDYRFGPIQEEELSSLSYTVYILNKPELVLIKELTDPPKFFFEKLRRARLNPKKYGIIIKTRPIFSLKNSGGQAENSLMFDGINPPKSGLLLPDLEGVETIEQQISIACHKAGIDPEMEKITIYKFTVEKYS